MMSGFKLGYQTDFSFGSAVVLCHLGIGISKDFGIILLSAGLFLLVVFFTITVVLLAVTDIEVARIGFFEFAMDHVDG